MERSGTAKIMKFSIKDFLINMSPNPQVPADMVTFTEEILNGKLHFLCSEEFVVQIRSFPCRSGELEFMDW